MEYKKIDLNDWERTGEGATALSFFHKTNPNLMLKLFTGEVTTSRYALKEMKFAQHVEKCGISTPKAYDVVIADGKIGIIYQRITGKVSYSRLIADHPMDINHVATMFVRELKLLHSKKCDTAYFVGIKDIVTQAINGNKLFGKRTKKKLLSFVEELGDSDMCLHGDAHTGNVIVADGKSYWIDLGAFTHGNPWYDIGGVYFFYRLFFGRLISRKFLHMNMRTLKEFWQYFVYAYTGDRSEENFKAFTKKARKACVLFTIYTMDIEHYTGFKGLLASLLVKDLSLRFK